MNIAKKRYYSLGLVVSLAVAWAPYTASAAFHEQIRERAADLRQERKDERGAVRTEIKEPREMMKEKADMMKGKAGEMKADAREEMMKMKEEMREKRSALQEEIAKRREEFQAKAEERREALKKKLGENRAARIEQFFAAMARKFEDAIDRLEKSAERIEERIGSSGAGEADKAVLQERMTAARAKIAEAQAEFESAKTRYADAVKDPDFKAAFKKVHDIVRGVAAKVKDAHRALVDAVAGLKSAAAPVGSAAPTESAPVAPAPTPNQ